MSGYYLVCKNHSNGGKCSTRLSGDSKDDLLKIALEHMTSVHGEKDCLGLRDHLRARMKRQWHVSS